MTKVVAVIQARTHSTRLRDKVLLEIAGKPMLWHVIERTKKCQTVNNIVVATTEREEDAAILQLAEKCQVEGFAGDENDVLDRFYQAAKKSSATIIVRITADCPLIHPPTIDEMVKRCEQEKVDYVCLDPAIPTFEVGVEVMTCIALEKAKTLAKNNDQKEHVTLYIRENPDLFSITVSPPSFKRDDIRLTVDEEADFRLMCEIYRRLYKENQTIDLRDVVTLFDDHPELKQINATVKSSKINQHSFSDAIEKKIFAATKHEIDTSVNREHSGNIIDTKEGSTIIDCNHCAFKHIIPIPLPEELEALYQKEYYSNEKPKYIQEVEEDREWWEITYKDYYRLFEKFLKKETKSILDIGSGPGYFLKCGQELGWTVTGIEPAKQAYEYSQQFSVNVVHDFLTENLAKKLGKFDVIFMDTVIEHVPDPISFLKTAKKMLHEEGIFCIISPNDYNPLQNILREQLHYDPWWVVPRHHINYFDFNSMQNLLEKLGFEILETTATFPMEFFLLCGEEYVGNDKMGRACHAKRKTFEKNLYKSNPKLIQSLYRSLAKMGIGRKFVILARNKS